MGRGAEPWQVLRVCPAQAMQWFSRVRASIFRELFVGKSIDSFGKGIALIRGGRMSGWCSMRRCRCDLQVLVVEPWQFLRLCPAQVRRWFLSHEFIVENYLWGNFLNLFIEVLH